MSKRTVVAEETETEVVERAATEPPPRTAETFDPVYVGEALANAIRQLALVSTVRAEYDHALGLIREAASWVIKGQNAEPTIHKDANIPAGT